MNAVLNESRAVEIAQDFLTKLLEHPPPKLLMVRHRSVDELAEASEQIRQLLAGCGITDDRTVSLEIARAGCSREHWIVAFKEPAPPGTATTLHATMVRVFIDTGEAMLAN